MSAAFSTGLKSDARIPGTADRFAALKRLALEGDERFFAAMREATITAAAPDELLALSNVRKHAAAKGLVSKSGPVRIAVLAGYTCFPLTELMRHYLATIPSPVALEACLFEGEFDNYVSEILDEGSALYEFRPQVTVLIPSHRRCRYSGDLFDSRDRQESEARQCASQILELCSLVNRRIGSEVVIANFPLPGRSDPGPYRVRTLGSDWSFRKLVNLELGLRAQSFVHICDAEFLSARRGTLTGWDARAWYESKQPYSAGLMVDVARELAYIIERLRRPPRKVAVLDLDNTLWGGVIGDDGLSGIEIGDTSPRGEAFKAFQSHLLSLTRRGVLLAVCSKNEHHQALEPFEKHPEMVLRLKDFVSFMANWRPKPDNIRQIALELNLALDSFVFIDDNPAEIEIVRQALPEVETILLGPDPAEYVGTIQDCRFFEPDSITPEDVERAAQYRQETERHDLLASATDMDAYLSSLEMKAVIREFRAVDVPRIAQLVNKTNQFNLTTRRRTEAEIEALMRDPAMLGFTVRLSDRFGDYGLIAIVVGIVRNSELEIDTWLMSCRVLKRQVEDVAMNELVRLARLRNISQIRGVYIPTAKNGMVREHYPSLGFTYAGNSCEFLLDPRRYDRHPTHIQIIENSYDAERSDPATPTDF